MPKSGTGDSTAWRDFGDSKKGYANGAWTEGAIGRKGGLWHSPAVTAGQAWYPANGCRLPASGYFVVVDEVGHAWSSSLIATQASFLRLWDPSISPNFPIPRGYAFSVRCIRE